MLIFKLLRPWVIAVGSSLTAYAFAKKGKGSKNRLREAKLELIEQQRTIDRLRAFYKRPRNTRRRCGKWGTGNLEKHYILGWA